jgi:DNA-binding beta-propeller fold protein YncE
MKTLQILMLNKKISGWDVSTASYDNKNVSVSSQDSYPCGLFFKPDGTKMYITGYSNNKIYQYSLSTAWDVSTASYDNKNVSVVSQDSYPFGLFFKPDGTKMYITGDANDKIYQYSLSTAWDVSTASYDNKSFYVSSQNNSPCGLFFKPDGTKMYITGYSNNKIYQYSLSTAWDVSTASYDNKIFYVGGQDSYPYGLFFKPDGTKMYITGNINDKIYQYSLSTAWDVSTASYDNKNVSVVSQDSYPFGLFFKPDGTKMYITGNSNDKIYQYSLT